MTDTWKRWEGQVVNGEFPLQRYLGGSDHSAVFLTQRGSEKAAIKLIAADPENAEAQLSRWRLAARLSHPHLLRIFGMGRAKLDNTDLLYLVMEFADDDLSQILPQRALTPQEAQEMLKPVLRALAYILGEHCVHGRVRPSNILAVGDEVKISSDSLSASGETARREASVYDAPESAAGAISPAADVWSLGVTLVEALTQHLPDPTQSGYAVLPAGMPPQFQDIARRCLHADPHQRWTVAQIAARLEPAATPKAAASAAATSRLATPIERTSAPTDNKTSAKWLYVVPVVAAGVVAWLLMSGSNTKTPKPPEQPAPVEQRQVQPTSSPQLSPAKPKKSSVTPAKAPSRNIQEAGNSTAAAPVVAAPPATTPKPEAVPAIKASSAAGIPGVVHTVMPAVSQSARNTLQGKLKVRVRVQVDNSGNVVSAVLDSPGPSKYFARLALEAARGWKFTPAQAHGQFVPSEWTLRFGFTRRDTEVVPAQTAP
jgi:TonB family protein